MKMYTVNSGKVFYQLWSMTKVGVILEKPWEKKARALCIVAVVLFYM